MSRSPWTSNRNLREGEAGAEISSESPAEKREEPKTERREENHSQTGPSVRLATLLPFLLSSGKGKLRVSKPHNTAVNG